MADILDTVLVSVKIRGMTTPLTLREARALFTTLQDILPKLNGIQPVTPDLDLEKIKDEVRDRIARSHVERRTYLSPKTPEQLAEQQALMQNDLARSDWANAQGREIT